MRHYFRGLVSDGRDRVPQTLHRWLVTLLIPDQSLPGIQVGLDLGDALDTLDPAINVRDSQWAGKTVDVHDGVRRSCLGDRRRIGWTGGGRFAHRRTSCGHGRKGEYH